MRWKPRQEAGLICLPSVLGNNLDDSAAKFLSEALTVSYLILNPDGYFTSEKSSSCCFIFYLQGDYVVKELDLSHNSFCEAGGTHLGEMLGTVL